MFEELQMQNLGGSLCCASLDILFCLAFVRKIYEFISAIYHVSF